MDERIAAGTVSRPTPRDAKVIRSDARIETLRNGYNYGSTTIRRPFDCKSRVIKVTVT